MNATMITCPTCGAEIPLSEALKEQFRHENEERLKLLTGQAEQKARAVFAVEKEFLEGQLAQERRKLQEAQRAELELRNERESLEARSCELDLEVARRVDGEKQRVAGQQDLRLKEKDKLIEDLRTALEDAKRKSEQGSQERQGEVLEIDVEAELARRFPQDAILPVAKGARGADIVQEVRDDAMRVCGTIVWETKNARNWQRGWLDKVKQDQRAVGANLAVIVSTALPDGIVEFGRIDGVLMASLRTWPALAAALREQLIQVAFAHAPAEGKHEKMEFLYRYLAGYQFRRRIEATVEAFTALRNGLTRERNAMERIWNEREKQIERVLANTAGMYGEVRGILGASVRPVAALELEASAGRLADATADLVAKWRKPSYSQTKCREPPRRSPVIEARARYLRFVDLIKAPPSADPAMSATRRRRTCAPHEQQGRIEDETADLVERRSAAFSEKYQTAMVSRTQLVRAGLCPQASAAVGALLP